MLDSYLFREFLIKRISHDDVNGSLNLYFSSNYQNKTWKSNFTVRCHYQTNRKEMKFFLLEISSKL